MAQYVGCVCPYCEGTMARYGRRAPSRDHKVPRARGGSDHPDNIHICCRRCNEDKGSLDHDEYLAVRAGLATRLDKGRHARVAYFLPLSGCFGSYFFYRPR